MVRDYFGDFANGRLKSIPFMVRWLVLLAIFFGVLIGIGAAIGITERLAGGDVEALQRELAQNLGGPFAIAMLVFLVLVLIANLNIIAKRARDVGLPGWLTAIGIAGLSGGISQVAGPTGTGGLGLLLLIVLTFLPTDMLRSL
jgi:uncharacterized membrane protein YhaH (DUF805 family)